MNVLIRNISEMRIFNQLYWFVISKLKLIKIKKRNLDIKNTSWENSKWWNCSQRQLIQEIAYFSHYPWTASKNSAFFLLFFINLFSINKLACMISRDVSRSFWKISISKWPLSYLELWKSICRQKWIEGKERKHVQKFDLVARTTGKNHFLKDNRIKWIVVRPSDAFMHPDPSVLALKEDGFRSEWKGIPCSWHLVEK